MSSLLTTVIVTASLCAAVVLGCLLRRLLPQDHLSSDSKDAVKLAMSLVATMTALLLGLLVSSAKSTYDTSRSALIQMAEKVAVLDRALALYGPEAAEIRVKLRDALGEAINRMWPDEPGVPANLAPDERAGDAVFVALHRLSPPDDLHRDLKAQAVSLAVELAEIRTLLLAQSSPSVSMPMLLTVDCWLMFIFVSFALVAPSNATTTVALVAAVTSVTGAVFLILELDEPLAGIIRISSAPMLAVFSHLVR